MFECNSIEALNIYRSLNDQQQFRLSKTNEVRDYFIAEIRERESMSKKLTKYIVCFYFDTSLIVLSATSGSISFYSFLYYSQLLLEHL